MKRVLIAVAVAGFALWVRMPVLRQGLWEDEATAVYVAKSPTIHEFVRRQAAIDYSPPLFNAVLAGYGRLFGFGEVSVKALAIGMGALACGAIALAAAEAFGAAGGVLAGLFAAESSLLIDMSAEVRPYSLSGALAALSIWAVFRFRRRRLVGEGRRTDVVLPAVLFSLAATSHYAGTVAVCAIGAFALAASFRRQNRFVWLPLAGAAAVAGIVFIPWAPIAWKQVHIGFPWAGVMRPSSRRSIATFKVLSLLPGMPAYAGTWTVLALALATAAALASSPEFRREIRTHAAAFGVLATAIAVPFFTVGLKAPPIRYVTIPVALSMILIGGAGGLVLTAARKSGAVEGVAAAAAVILACGCAVSKAADARGRSLAAARAGVPKTIMRAFFRDGTLRPGDLVIGAPDMIGPTLWYYAPSGVTVRGFVHWEEPAFEEFGDYARLWPDPGVVDRCLAALDRDVAAVRPRRVALVWAVGGDGALPIKTRTDELRDGIRRRFAPVATRDFRGPGERIRIDFFDVR
jgi:dolichyl-phosphate-mannose-protein mannosyltransferase